MIQTIARDLEALVTLHTPALKQIPADTLLNKPLPGKWSKQEIIGHLIDSAQNNIRRFVVAQYEENPAITYNQDKWVAVANYQQQPSQQIIELWALLNLHLYHILHTMPDESTQRIATTGAPHTLEWLAEDYVKHLKHHLHQVLDLEPFPYTW
jgi:hypothetical protein